MIINKKQWNHLILLCLGIILGAAFCMKWIEKDFLLNNEVFTIIGLELTYSKERVVDILSSITPEVKSVLTYHLTFDYIFMIGVYPGIASICMYARSGYGNKLSRKILLTAALFQVIAFGCDIIENLYLLNWLNKPVIETPEFDLFHIIVSTKWFIAILALCLGLFFLIKKKIKPNSHFLI